MRLARVLNLTGRTMITLGVLILLFVAYQLWGTGIREAQAQDRLTKQFNDILSEAQNSSDVVGATDPTATSGPSDLNSTTTATSPVQTAPPPTVAPTEGDPIGKIEISK